MTKTTTLREEIKEHLIDVIQESYNVGHRDYEDISHVATFEHSFAVSSDHAKQIIAQYSLDIFEMLPIVFNAYSEDNGTSFRFFNDQVDPFFIVNAYISELAYELINKAVSEAGATLLDIDQAELVKLIRAA